MLKGSGKGELRTYEYRESAKGQACRPTQQAMYTYRGNLEGRRRGVGGCKGRVLTCCWVSGSVGLPFTSSTVSGGSVAGRTICWVPSPTTLPPVGEATPSPSIFSFMPGYQWAFLDERNEYPQAAGHCGPPRRLPVEGMTTAARDAPTTDSLSEC